MTSQQEELRKHSSGHVQYEMLEEQVDSRHTISKHERKSVTSVVIKALSGLPAERHAEGGEQLP